MTDHDKIEHELPNGDVLVQDSTRSRPDVDEAFRRLEADLERQARETYERLRTAA